jgi:hypothetical protein
MRRLDEGDLNVSRIRPLRAELWSWFWCVANVASATYNATTGNVAMAAFNAAVGGWLLAIARGDRRKRLNPTHDLTREIS